MSKAPPFDRAVVLGVAGGSGSGKTTVAERILEAVGPDRLAFLSQDSYYRDVDWKSSDQQADHNFDHPNAIDTPLLVEQIAQLRRGEPVEVPIYDFVIHRRRTETQAVQPRRVVLVEGILLLVEPELRELLDFKIFVDTDADVRLARRLQRDIAERGRTMESVLHQYMGTVRPMHLEFVEPSKRWADIIVPEGGENRVALEMVTARLQQLLGDLPPLAGH
ncbi:MAG: uridine kinase [Thermoanaerobaculia bacterium]|nr:uridine kinase [Thermoanaerobaculia bacterium]